MTVAAAVAFTLCAVAVAVAAGEFAFTIAWRHVPLHVGGFFIGRWLSRAPRATIRRRIAELFPASLLLDRRPAARWQVWYNVHIPAFVARCAAPRRATLVTSAILDGLIDATRELVAHESPEKVSEPISYDSFWPVLEALEEIAAQLAVEAHDAFAEKLLELCCATEDKTVQATTAWIVNELGERSSLEKRLACTVTRRLYIAAPPTARGALQLLGKMHPHIERQLLLLQDRPAVQDACLDRFEQSRETALTHIREFVARLEPSAHNSALRLMQSLCAMEGLEHPSQFRGLTGLIWMACLRTAFRELCSTTESDLAIRSACIAAMICSDERNTCAFLTIEALESARNRKPKQCMAAMSGFLQRSSGRFDQGIAVCAAEGYEEHGKDLTILHRATTDLLQECRGVSRAAPLERWIHLRLGLRGVNASG